MSPIGSVRSSYPVEGAAALGFRQSLFAVHRACSFAASDLILFQGVCCAILCSNQMVISRLPKERDIRKQWVFVAKRVTTENNAWIPGARL